MKAKTASSALRLTALIVSALLLLLGMCGCGGRVADVQSSSAESQQRSQTETSTGGGNAPQESQTETPVVPTPQAEVPSSSGGTGGGSSYTGDFVIEGKWKNISETGIGQAQPGAIIVFDGANCNLISPRDTYAFYKNGSDYRLDWTTMLGSSGAQTIHVVDRDHMEIYNGADVVIEFQRVG
jgi:hypothetical protein